MNPIYGFPGFKASFNEIVAAVLRVGKFADFKEYGAAPNPAARTARIYARDEGGTTVVGYRRSDGFEFLFRTATQAEMEAAASGGAVAWSAPANQHFHPGHPKARGRVNSDGSLVSGGYNVASSVRNSTGFYTVTLTNAMADANYEVQATAIGSGSVCVYAVTNLTATTFDVTTRNNSGAFCG